MHFNEQSMLTNLDFVHEFQEEASKIKVNRR